MLLEKPIVSASALQTDGQILLLNSPALPPGDISGGPCYRCIWAKPPPPETITSCGDGGIIGPVVGVMGVLQALEAIKLIASGRLNPAKEASAPNPTTMLLFSTNKSSPFRTIRLKGRRSNCFACGEKPQLSLEQLNSGSMDYIMFCGMLKPVQLLSEEERVEAREFHEIMKKGSGHVLIDVREKVQFDICSIEGSQNFPFSEIKDISVRENGPLSLSLDGLDPKNPIYVVCRLGNDSQVITKRLKELGYSDEGRRFIGDIKGGLKAWREQVDGSWPEY